MSHALIYSSNFSYLKRSFIFFILILFTNFSYAKINLNGISYCSHKEIASKLKLNGAFNAQKEEVDLIGPDIFLSLINKKRYVIINNIQVWLGHPIFLNKNELYISEDDFSKVIAPIIAPQNYSMPPKLFHIVIDPGHGGRDEGTKNFDYKLKEKDLTLDLSFRLMRELERNGYKVTLTRTKDQYIALKNRSEFANNAGADLFISIHFNSVEKGKETVQGIETYVLSLENHPSTSAHTVIALDKEKLPGNKNDSWSSLVGYNIQSSLIANLNAQDRGLRRSRFAVLKTLNCPGVLVEVGFLSNSEECKKITSLAYRQKIAESLTSGIKAYQKNLNQIRNFN